MYPRRSARIATLKNQTVNQHEITTTPLVTTSTTDQTNSKISINTQPVDPKDPVTSISDKMNIELSTEQLINQLDPLDDASFIPFSLLSQDKPLSQQNPQDDLLTPLIATPSNSQQIRNYEWRFNDPNLKEALLEFGCSAGSTNPEHYDPQHARALGDLVDSTVAYTPQSTPPHQQQNDLSNIIIDLPDIDLVDMLNNLENSQHFEQMLANAGGDVPDSTYDVAVSPVPSIFGSPEEENSSHLDEPEVNHELLTQKEPSSLMSPMEIEPEEPALSPEPVPGPSSKPKSRRGRKRKVSEESKIDKKRKQNANAAKNYRARVAKENERIFSEKEKLEKMVDEARKKMQSKMNQRNLMLSMLYELALEKGSVSMFNFPPWMETFYQEYKKSGAF